jgi:PAS domain S-box-containing protein
LLFVPDWKELPMSGAVSFRTQRDWMETVGLNEGGLVALIQNLPIGFMIQGPQTEILFSNRAAQDMLGLSESQLLGESSCAPQWDVIHEDGTPFPSETHPAARAAATGQPVRNVVMGVCRASRQDPVWLMMNADLQLATDGSVTCVVCTFTDISERKRAEEALLESQQRHEELLRSIDGIVWECDPQTLAFTFVSEQAERMLGYPPERWLSEPTFWLDHLHAEDRDEAVSFCVRASEELRPHQLEYRMIAADGRVVWLRDIVTVIAKEGRPVKSRGIMVDVTESKRAEEALRRSDAFNRHIVESSTDCIKILDLEGNLLYVNRFGQQALGINDLSSCLGNPWLDLCQGADTQAAYSAIFTAKAGGIGIFQNHCLTSQGNPSWWHVVVTPMRDAQGNVERLLAVSRDITESKRGEEALRESEERMRAILRAMPDLMFLVDGQRVIIDYHARDRSDLFVPPEHFLGKKVEDVLPPPVSQGLRQCFELAAQSREPILFEYSLPLQGGTLYFEARVVGCAGNRFLSIVRNITERKRAEESLRESERRYALASAAGRVGVWDWNLKTNEIYVEPLLKRLLGYEDHEIRNHMDDWGRLVHPEDAQRVSAELRECLEGRSLHFESEHRMLHKDGSIRWFLARGLARRDDTGSLSRMSGTDMEITEQKRMREALRETEALKQAVLNSLQDNIAVLNQKGTIVAVNEVWNRFASENEATSLSSVGVGVNYLDVCRRVSGTAGAEYAQQSMSGIRAVLDGTRETFAMEYNCPSPTEDRWFLMTVAPLKRPEGGAVVSHTNITERKHADEIVRQSRKELQVLTGRLISAQEEERRRLARELHDDFSQALAVLAIDAGILEQQGRRLPDGIRQMLGKLTNQIVQLSSGIHGLSRQLHPAILDDLGLVDAIRSECLHVSKREGVSVEFTPGSVPDVFPREVSLCLYRVTQEGLRNIAKHSRARHAQISLGQDNGSLRLVIQDDGLGFDPAQLRRKGGLGLASMSERVRMLQAELLVHSEPGRGTRLEVSIPLQRTDAATAG